MLTDKEQFEIIETALKENGTIERFEMEQEKIRGRMMITLGEAPDIVNYDNTEEGVYPFIGSFDLYDMEIGILLQTKPVEARSSIWFTPQTDNAEEPTQEWIEFFIKTLVSNIDEDGGFGIPICTFTADVGDFTVTPITDEDFLS